MSLTLLLLWSPTHADMPDECSFCVPHGTSSQSSLWKNLEVTRCYEWDTLDFEEQVAFYGEAEGCLRSCPSWTRTACSIRVGMASESVH